MALANYSNLQAEIALYLARSDLTAIIPDFITLSEAKLKRKFKGITPLSAGNNWLFTASPDVYLYGALLEAQPYLQDDARIPTWATIFERVVAEVRLPDTASNFADYAGLQASVADWLNRPDLTNAIPNFIRLTEAKLQRKFVGVTTLTTSNTTNWLLTAHPDAYLYGTLLEAEPYLKDDARIAIWKEGFQSVVSAIRLPSTTANFTNYNGLKSVVADWLDRPDLTNVIPTFISLAEKRLSRDLRIRQMLKVVTTTMAAGDSTVELPSDYLQMRDLHINTNPVQVLSYQSPSNFYRNTNSAISGVPLQYTVLAQEFQFAPIPDSSYTLQMIYYATPPALSSSVASNMFLANCPDLLLYGALSEAEPYLMNDPRIQVWASLYDRALSALTVSDDQGEYGGSPLSISIATR